MADKVYKLSLPDGSGGWEDVDVKLADNGDGTYSVAVEGSISIDPGDIKIGSVDVDSIAAGDNNIGNVDIVSLPALPVGTNIIGKVSIDQATANANEVVIKSITAGETHLGEVGGSTINVAVTPAITAGAYGALDTIGGIQTIANASRASGKPTTLQSLIIKDLAMQSADFRIWFFNANPVTGTYTDNSALDIDDTDFGLCVGVVNCSNGEWVNGLDNGVLFLNNIGLVMTPAITSLFAVVEIIGIKTFASVADLTFIYGFFRE